MSDTVKAWIEERRAIIRGAREAIRPAEAIDLGLIDLPRALDALNAVLELHVKETGGTPDGGVADVCSCGVSYWPCATVRAIESALKAAETGETMEESRT